MNGNTEQILREEKKSSIIFKVTDDEKWLLKEAASKNRITMQAYIMEAIHEKLKKDGLE